MSAEGNVGQGQSAEESDQLQRSVKKHKRDEDGQGRNTFCHDEEMGIESGWTRPSFADAVQGKTQQWDIYTGEDEEDCMDDLAMSDVVHTSAETSDPATCPVVEMPWEEYKSWWLPWRRALILRVLGKTFSFGVLEPRIRKMWQLKNTISPDIKKITISPANQ